MSLIARLEKLETRLKVKPRSDLPPSLVCVVGADGSELIPQTIHQLGSIWPFEHVREWHRGQDESADAFERRVLREAGPNAMLVPVAW